LTKKKDEEEFNTKGCVRLLNSIFSKWGFVKIHVNRSQSYENGERITTSNVVVEFPEVYDYFRFG
jgi:hypothetical protein